MKKIYDEEIIEFYKSTFDIREIFDNKDYLTDTFEKIEEFCIYKKIKFDELIETLKELSDISLKQTLSQSQNDTIRSSSKVIEIILWPIFNDKNFKNKKYKNYDIDISFFDDFLKQLYVDVFNKEEESRVLIDFKFEKKKLKYLIYEVGGGILHVYEKNKFKKMIFCDGSEIEIPEDM